MATVASIDWLKWMQVNLLDQPGLADAYPNEWILSRCRVAAEMAVTESSNTEPRLQSGDLSEETFAYVVCSMVIRVMRWSRFKTESNGNYSYTEHDPQSNPPGYDASPNLYVSKREKQLLDGYADGRGPIGTVGLGVQRIYGL
ncbi:hypothetical protein [Bifidobacterium platyrrhinorum]|uniref:Phage protein n=1 Tax=Bifidobacterium platyrrhinorum TaxID=2661628 RepID=A0A6L9STW7_9BIFI|nr:hypothetical protein [Bifidobacterium platyrrhinorum]NEG55465.1 hypothetical protein [Bifidobacterium platyrrhinorum]